MKNIAEVRAARRGARDNPPSEAPESARLSSETPRAAMTAQFFFDVGSPYAWLTAERIEQLLGTVCWRPVLLGGIFAATGRSSWARTERRGAGMAEIEERAQRYGLPAPVWPDPWPNDGLYAMQVAAAAARSGRARDFALAAMRLAFTEGQPLSDPTKVRIAAERGGLAAEVVSDATSPEGKADLRRRTEEALAVGVFGVPTVVIDGAVHWGDDRLETLAPARPQS